MTNIRELHLRYIQVSDFKKRITYKFPDLSIQLLPKTILFDGHASDIEAAKSDLNAFIDSLSIHTIDSIDRFQLEIIQSKQAIEYITSLLKSLNLLVTWEVDKGMLIFCCSQDSVVFCHRVLVELIKKKIVTTPSDSSVLYTSELWRECVTNIDKKYKGLCNLYLKKDESGVTIVATDNVVDEVAHEVQMFLTDHAMMQQTMTTDFVVPKTSLQNLLEQAILELPNHLLNVVSSLIPVCSNEQVYRSHKFIFTLRGTAKGIRLLKMSLNNKYKLKIY